MSAFIQPVSETSPMLRYSIPCRGCVPKPARTRNVAAKGQEVREKCRMAKPRLFLPAGVAPLEQRENRPQAERFTALGTPRRSCIAPRVGVEMRPGDPVGHEALEEQSRGDAP